MPEFLKLLLPQDARKVWFDAMPEMALQAEEIDTIHALGRVIAADVHAPHPLPAFSRSAMDGYAVRAVDTYGASDSLPAYLNVIGEVLMGTQPQIKLGPAQAALIHTGGMLPENADAVVMLEYTQSTRASEVEVARAVAPYENIIRIGEDVKTGQVVIPRGSLIRPAEIGGLMAFGFQSVQVTRRPRVAILSSGDEVVSPDVTPTPGQVRDINSYSLSAQVEGWGGIPVRYGIVPDRAESLEIALEKSLADCDAVIITAGSSASSRDLTSRVIQKSGQPGVLVHGVSIRPGKPTILAVCNGKPVMGLPGNPISALVISWLFLQPLLYRMAGLRKEPQKNVIQAKLNVNVASLAGREDWVPVAITLASDGYRVDPVFFKSNLIFNLVNADGLMVIPAEATGIIAEERVQVYVL